MDRYDSPILYPAPEQAIQLFYNMIADHIRSHFSETVRGDTLLSKEDGFGSYEINTNPGIAYGTKRKIAGLFNSICYYLPNSYFSRVINVAVIQGTKVKKLSSGSAETLEKIVIASDLGEESVIADIMIAAACRDIMQSDSPIRIARVLSRQAYKILTEQGYGWWRLITRHHIYNKCKSYDKAYQDLRMCLKEQNLDAEKIGDAILSMFSYFIDDPTCTFEVLIKESAFKDVFLYEFYCCDTIKKWKAETKSGSLTSQVLTSLLSQFHEKEMKQFRERCQIDRYGSNDYDPQLPAHARWEDRLLAAAESRIIVLIQQAQYEIDGNAGAPV